LSSVNPRATDTTKPKLDLDVVVDAALGVADAEGLEAVTIRRLADHLSASPMGLYWHFKDKKALFAAVGARMWDETSAELERRVAALGPTEDVWAPLRITMETLTEAMRRHPAVAPLVATEVLECQSGLEVTERTLAFLAERGFEAWRAAAIARFVLCSAVMLVENQPGGAIIEPDERAEAQRRKKLTLAYLPVGRYPYIAAAADFLTDCDSTDKYFEEGIELVIAGVSHQEQPKT
jgi:TetR/AcrR family transcriptional regulator, tetracycline repressor protein